MEKIIKKFRFKGDGTVLNAPAPIEKALTTLGFQTTLNKKESNSNTLVFLNNRKELMAFLTGSLKNIEPDSVLWLPYPKGSSKIKTDINRDIIRVTAENSASLRLPPYRSTIPGAGCGSGRSIRSAPRPGGPPGRTRLTVYETSS